MHNKRRTGRTNYRSKTAVNMMYHQQTNFPVNIAHDHRCYRCQFDSRVKNVKSEDENTTRIRWPHLKSELASPNIGAIHWYIAYDEEASFDTLSLLVFLVRSKIGFWHVMHHTHTLEMLECFARVQFRNRHWGQLESRDAHGPFHSTEIKYMKCISHGAQRANSTAEQFVMAYSAEWKFMADFCVFQVSMRHVLVIGTFRKQKTKYFALKIF